ncbi:Ditrans,polycis-undecaprenyl-diphosphate synthase ((2E,6E)-farnesyl-diphosphate specific) [Grimontia celer]|uniref:Ditrans,polycis-undecaprenyl-diphosphate synthase ((2E,6E)-farnesyl-diphosphate specific) n=1 Tax=Grimontia celer TaxID=1796497 RepID=A0A128FFP4_9GAMM|nr:isoprenyl transferase [Grimontia celer]CZF85091.1 Ditrans,polycis-undecaprenyl-diphosphate synthase ((2E,6E)-farnesyl-diphosphate specific) [Grimontia celer]
MSSQSFHQEIDPSLLPKHIAVIMDGNGRWAKARGKARMFGHKAGVDAVRKTVSTANRLGVQVLTLFAFSSENWRRPEEEVSLLMELFVTVLGREVKRLHKNGVKLKVIGDTTRFSQSLQDKIAAAEALTANNTGLVLNVAANYGGQWDIMQAVKKLAAQVERGEIPAEQLTEGDLQVHLSCSGLPDVDLMIRTSGECRISNFMLWQAAYAELYFTEQFWPDFDETSLTEAIAWFINRERRFGCTGEQIKAMLQVEK